MGKRTYQGVRTSRGTMVTVDMHPLPPRFDLANHSPTGFEWGSVNRMDFKVTISTDKLESVGVISDLFNSHTPTLISATVDVVEMEGIVTLAIAADGTLSSQGFFENQSLGTFFVTPAFLLTGTTSVFPSLVTVIRQRLLTFEAVARTFQVYCGAQVLFAELGHLSTLTTSPLSGETSSAKPGLVIATDTVFTARAISEWLRAHSNISLSGYYTTMWHRVQSVIDGPAQLALAILADHFQNALGRNARAAAALALRNYQQFKHDVISAIDQDRWTLTTDDIEESAIDYERLT